MKSYEVVCPWDWKQMYSFSLLLCNTALGNLASDWAHGRWQKDWKEKCIFVLFTDTSIFNKKNTEDPQNNTRILKTS